MNIAANNAGLVVMWSESASPTPPAGGALFTLNDIDAATFRGMLTQQNGGITYINGVLTQLPFVAPPPFDFSNSDNLDKIVKAVLLAAAIMAGKTAAQAKAAFLTAWQALP